MPHRAHAGARHRTGAGAASAAQRVLLPLLRAGGDRLGRWSRARRPRPCRRPARAAAGTRAPSSGPPMTRGARLAGVRALHEAGQRWSWDGVGSEWRNPRAGDAAARLPDNAELRAARHERGRPRRLLTGDIGLRARRHACWRSAGIARRLLLCRASRQLDFVGRGLLDAMPRPGADPVRPPEPLRPPAPGAGSACGSGWHTLGRFSPLWCHGAASWRSDSPGRIDCWHQTRRRYWQAAAVAGSH